MQFSAGGEIAVELMDGAGVALEFVGEFVERVALVREDQASGGDGAGVRGVVERFGAVHQYDNAAIVGRDVAQRGGKRRIVVTPEE